MHQANTCWILQAHCKAIRLAYDGFGQGSFQRWTKKETNKISAPIMKTKQEKQISYYLRQSANLLNNYLQVCLEKGQDCPNKKEIVEFLTWYIGSGYSDDEVYNKKEVL